MPKIRVSLNIGFPNARQEEILDIPEDEWNSCETDRDKEKLIDEYATEWAWDYIDIGAELIE